MTEYTGKENLDFLEKVPHFLDEMQGIILDFIGDHKNVLDFGAGSAIYARRLAAKNIRPDCVEIDEEYLKNLSALGFKAYRTLEETGKPYERIYTCDVIEHIDDDIAILTQLHKRLSMNGKIFIYVPAFMMLYSEMDKKIGHYRRYTKKELVRKMKTAGFKIESAYYIDFIGFFGGLYYKYFVKKEGDIALPITYKYYKNIFPISRVLDKLGARYLMGKNLLVIASK